MVRARGQKQDLAGIQRAVKQFSPSQLRVHGWIEGIAIAIHLCALVTICKEYMFSARHLAEQHMRVVEVLVKLTPGAGRTDHQVVRRRWHVQQEPSQRPGYPLKIISYIILSESMTFPQHSWAPPKWIVARVVE